MPTSIQVILDALLFCVESTHAYVYMSFSLFTKIVHNFLVFYIVCISNTSFKVLVHKVYILVGEIRYKLMKPSINAIQIALYTDTIKDKLEIIRGQ